MSERSIARLLALLATAGAILVLAAVAVLPGAEGIAPLVRARLAESGVAQPVTAVLLNFRSLDTLLEVSVLAAAVGAAMLPAAGSRRLFSTGPVVVWLVRLLLPAAVLVAGYLWWAGTSRSGGAFQAGVTVAAALLLGWLGGRADSIRPTAGKRLAAAGPLLFLAVAAVPALLGHPFLTYPTGWAKPLIILIEGALTVSIGAALALLVQAPVQGKAP